MTDAYLTRITFIVCTLCLTFAFTSLCTMLCILWRAKNLPDACSIDRDAVDSKRGSVCDPACDTEDYDSDSIAIYVR